MHAVDLLESKCVARGRVRTEYLLELHLITRKCGRLIAINLLKTEIITWESRGLAQNILKREKIASPTLTIGLLELERPARHRRRPVALRLLELERPARHRRRPVALRLRLLELERTAWHLPCCIALRLLKLDYFACCWRRLITRLFRKGKVGAESGN